ncbi:histidine ammonia-lyase [Bacillus sp. FJAT-29790]|uniref:histidine ammonia-lyase n=1 Tax=Bacillus sp. FJAT-29790 TaxID=1895002 RepID=UPI001C246C40|nr:histidine ammonia-lyase [Bacillus sp. FJAT-29790]MBU8879709.1 histidine ammonia-lyase [Bacillus sp. FJAT-29790]
MQFVEQKEVTIGGDTLSLEDVVLVGRYHYKVCLAENSKEKVIQSRQYVEKLLAEKKVVYGLTTGFGKFSDTYISSDDAKDLQVNLIRSHACGIGDPFPEEVVRAIIFLRINSLMRGNSGIRLQVIEMMVEMLNKGVIPMIPEKGSLGASGDLAPLSHLALVMMGEGEAYYNGELMEGGAALYKAGIAPVSLEAKEGLALINGTQVMTGVGAIACWDAMKLAKWADSSAALTTEVLRGVRQAFEPETHEIRPHYGQQQVARNVQMLTKGSQLMTNQGEVRVQDAYSLRCVPQVHGATRDALNYIHDKIVIEINSVTDNPLIFAEKNKVISGGNFHGQPIALVMDFLSIAVAELANISERRIERLVNPQLNDNLPPFLTKYGGTNSGFMIAQYAAASLVSENKSLAHPASVDSIPSSANQEDHVSMGTIAARKAAKIVENCRSVISIELLCGVQAADYRGAHHLGDGTKWVYSTCRKYVPFLDTDRVLYKDFQKAADFMKNIDVLREMEEQFTE